MNNVNLGASTPHAVRGNGGDQAPLCPMTAKTLMQKRFAQLRWVVPNLVPEGLVLLAGKPKMGKSWLALQLALSVARGRSYLDGARIEQGEALYLALEDTERRLYDRMAALLSGEVPPAGLELATTCPRMDQGGVGQLESWLEAHPSARLVVVDTLATIRAPSRGRAGIYQEEYDELRLLKRLADAARITLLVVHHLRKGLADDPLDEISGSTGLTGAADGVLVLQRRRGQANAVVRATGRDIEEQELSVVFNPSTGRWTTARSASRVRPRSAPREELLRLLIASHSGVTPLEASTQLQKSPVAVRKLLSEMAKAGEIGNPTRGLYTAITPRPRVRVTDIADAVA